MVCGLLVAVAFLTAAAAALGSRAQVWWCGHSVAPTSALLTLLTPVSVQITTLWRIPQEMGTPGHLTCLLRTLYAAQEATVKTGHGTTDWFQIGKGVPQGCILSPCLFNL